MRIAIKIIHKDYDVTFTQYDYDELVWIAFVDWSKNGGDGATMGIWHFLKSHHFKFIFGIRGIKIYNK